MEFAGSWEVLASGLLPKKVGCIKSARGISVFVLCVLLYLLLFVEEADAQTLPLEWIRLGKQSL